MPVLSWRANRSHASWMWWLGVVACTAWTIAGPQIRAARREVTADAAVRALKEAVADALGPAIRQLADDVATPFTVGGDARAAAAPLVQLVVDTVASFIGPSRVRANYFHWEPGPPQALVPERSSGRSRAPRTIFSRGTPAGDAAFEMLDTEGERFCEDVQAEDVPGWDPNRKVEYRTFLAVPVSAGQQAFGMLTVDAIHPGDLVPEDVALARVFAQILGAGLASIAFRREG